MHPLLSQILEKSGETFTFVKVKASTDMLFKFAGVTFVLALVATPVFSATHVPVFFTAIMWLFPVAGLIASLSGWRYFALNNPSMLRSEEYQLREKITDTLINKYIDSNSAEALSLAQGLIFANKPLTDGTAE